MLSLIFQLSHSELRVSRLNCLLVISDNHGRPNFIYLISPRFKDSLKSGSGVGQVLQIN